jgi:hypothetical protein
MAKGNKKADCGILGSLLIPALFGCCLYLIFTSINQSKLYEGVTEDLDSRQPVQVCDFPKVPLVKNGDQTDISFEYGNIHFKDPHRAHCGGIGSAKQIIITGEGKHKLGNKIECADGQGIKEGKCIDCHHGIPNPKKMIDWPDEPHAYTGLVEGDYHLEWNQGGGKAMVVEGGVECIVEKNKSN